MFITNNYFICNKHFSGYFVETRNLVCNIKFVYTTNEFKIPTAKTKKNHKPTPEKTLFLFCVQPSGAAKTTGTPIINKNDNAINAKRVN